MNLQLKYSRTIFLFILMFLLGTATLHQVQSREVDDTSNDKVLKQLELNSENYTISFSTYLGGSIEDSSNSIFVDTSDNIYVTGYTYSSNFPIKGTNADTTMDYGLYEVFVSKFDSSGSLVFSTYLGGSSNDGGYSIFVDTSENIYVAGYTNSPDFPIIGANADTTLGGHQDAFVSKFDSTGNLIFSTYLGGDGFDSGKSIFVDASENIYVAGYTRSSDFPTLGVNADTTLGGSYDAFVSKFDKSGSLVFSTYLGGDEPDPGHPFFPLVSVFVDASENIYVAGQTESLDFPTIGVNADTTLGGTYDAFVSKFDSSGTLIFSSYLGGEESDSGNSIFVDASENIYVAGQTESPDFPTIGANADTTLGGSSDAFVSKFDSSDTLIFSTYLGGDAYDLGNSIFIDASDNIYVTGRTHSLDFPTIGANADTIYSENRDAFVSKFDSSGILIFSTYLGEGGARGNAIFVDAAENIYVTGSTGSNFPTIGANADTTWGGGSDAFISKFDSGKTEVSQTDVEVMTSDNGFLVNNTLFALISSFIFFITLNRRKSR